jgi:hypothetical protein
MGHVQEESMQTWTRNTLVAGLLCIAPLASAQPPPIVVSLPDVVIANCEATILFEYSQRGSNARVSGEIENPTCAASEGSFTVSLRTSNDNFEQTTLDFEESWQRDDDQPVAFSRDYPIGDNVDLIRVRTSKAVCKCTAVAQ